MSWRLRCVVVSSLCLVLLLCGGCGFSDKKPKFDSEYQAVFLSNGQVFFGKIENAGGTYPLLKDVYYVQTKVDGETRQPTSILIKRGSEWHGPDLMYINSRQIVVIEPVAANSRVAQLIAEAKTQKPAEQK